MLKDPKSGGILAARCPFLPRAAVSSAVNPPRHKRAIRNKIEERIRNEKAKTNTRFLNIQKVSSTPPFLSQNYRSSFSAPNTHVLLVSKGHSLGDILSPPREQAEYPVFRNRLVTKPQPWETGRSFRVIYTTPGKWYHTRKTTFAFHKPFFVSEEQTREQPPQHKQSQSSSSPALTRAEHGLWMWKRFLTEHRCHNPSSFQMLLSISLLGKLHFTYLETEQAIHAFVQL